MPRNPYVFLRDNRKTINTYEEWLAKFDALPKTTDECWTPAPIMAAVVDYVCREYGVDPDHIVRPFVPGGDYQEDSKSYTDDTVVVDNPPFSIFAQIVRYYESHNIKYFIFAPSKTCLAALKYGPHVCVLPLSVSIRYANGANVPTSFVTNLEPPDRRIHCVAELYHLLDDINKMSNPKTIRSIIKTPPTALGFSDFYIISKWSSDFSLTDSDIGGFRPSINGRDLFGGRVIVSHAAAAAAATARETIHVEYTETEDAMVAAADARSGTFEGFRQSGPTSDAS